jgi:hypothetical protein
MKTVFALVGFLGSAAGFQSAMPKPSQPLTVVQGGRTATPLGRVSTKEGKAVKIDAVKEQLENAMLVFAVPSAGLTVNQMSSFRNRLPESAKAMVVKNKLMERCVAFPWFLIFLFGIERAFLPYYFPSFQYHRVVLTSARKKRKKITHTEHALRTKSGRRSTTCSPWRTCGSSWKRMGFARRWRGTMLG